MTQYVAMWDRSAGNESVGEMWTETKVFEETATIQEIYAWVASRGSQYGRSVGPGRFNIRLAEAQ